MRPRAVKVALALQFRAAPVGAALLLGCTVLIGVLPALVAWSTKLLFDELGRGEHVDSGRAVALGLVLATLGAVLAVLMQLAAYLDEVVRRRLVVTVERDLFAKVNEFRGLRRFEDPAFHDRLRLAQQASEDAPHNITMFSQEVVRSAAALSGFTGVLWAVWPPMVGLLFLVGVAALLARLSMARRQVAVLELTSGKQRRRLFYRSLLTDPRAAKEIRLFGLGDFLHGRLVRALTEATDAELAVARRGMLVQAGFAALNAVVAGLGMVVVVAGAARGRFTVGDVMLFTAAAAGVQQAFTGVVSQTGMAAEAIRLFGHFLDLMDTPDDLATAAGTGTGQVPALRGAVEFDDVWFRYDAHGPWVLRGVRLVIPAGGAVGLVGRNGTGKSTLIKLLCRFYDPDRGTIRWDGVDIRTMDAAALRCRIGVTFQDYMTYDLSAAENIGIGDLAHREDLARIRAGAVSAGIDADLSALPDGYRTQLSRVHLDEDDDKAGVTLSGGQWQRVALARSLMRADADLLILDEPSSGLDPEAEHDVHRTLHRHRAGRTSLLVSHRLGALRDADTIAVLADGRIAELGRHDQLMALADGHYARLFGLQAAGYRDSDRPDDSTRIAEDAQ
ncbi:ABC transporter ATP-binding protein/permease (plasmid) [Embleya sp. NBC_00888]|uniref:ABC transporter ATP-binding protein n=1 Tax=Embleya sp. NBC_00888 TaxID=2975960 RepID=UPI002F917F97|nr:ABC transporter ATP-binding protein/permease [Embleya sp. NBC_00888]